MASKDKKMEHLESFSIGKFPWSNEEIISLMDEFSSLYENRPIRDNQGGQLAAQLFYSWFAAKKLKPKYIIESGIWNGQGTWIFEQASPDSQIISLDPYPRYQNGYQSKKAYYLHDDFYQFNWSKLDKKSTLCFFDDHQDALMRLYECKRQGFKYVMFEDNYPPGQGDCYSLKKLFEEDDSKPQKEEVKQFVKVYHEFPPFTHPEKNRWGTPWNTYRSKPALIPVPQTPTQLLFASEMYQYTWINYVEIDQ